MKVMRVDSKLKAQQTFPWSKGRVFMDPVFGDREWQQNWVPKDAVEELKKSSKGFNFHVKREEFKIFPDQIRDENETEKAFRLKEQEKAEAKQKSISHERAQPLGFGSTEEIDEAIEKGVEKVEKEVELMVDQAKKITETTMEKTEAFGKDLVKLKTKALKELKEDINTEVEEKQEDFKPIKDEITDLLEKGDELKTEITDLKGDVEELSKDLKAAMNKTLEKFKEDADKITQKHLEAIKKATK